MKLLARILLAISTLCLPLQKVYACQDSTGLDSNRINNKYILFTEVGALVATSSQTPFWLRSNQYGIIPLINPAGIVRLGGTVHFRQFTHPSKIQFTLAAEAVANIGQPSKLLLPVANFTASYRNIEIYVGRRREVFGLVDTLLSSGSYSWSGNALPIPKIQIGTRGFAPLHFTKDFVALNAMYAHGWFGNQDSTQGSYLHQKAFYIRLGKPSHKIHAFAGILHYAQWGGHSAVVPKSLSQDGYFPSSWRAYLNVITAAQTEDDGTGQFSQFDLLNRVGNQLGSMDIGLSIKLSKSSLFGYIQHPYEDKSGVALKNLPDGLYGIRWRNETQSSNSAFQIKQITIEFLSTLDQSGFEIKTGNRQYDGADNYFNHGQYRDGWTYAERVIGTPLITRWLDTRPEATSLGLNQYPRTILNNTRVNMAHVAMLCQFDKDLILQIRLTHSMNFGQPGYLDPRVPLAQFSGLIQLNKKVNWFGGSELSLAAAIDNGKLLNNGLGGWCLIKKSIFKNY